MDYQLNMPYQYNQSHKYKLVLMPILLEGTQLQDPLPLAYVLILYTN